MTRRICHVRAASPGGPRYDYTQSDVERNSFETPIPRENYRLGAPPVGYWFERLNSDATLYGDSGQGNIGAVEAVPLPAHCRPCSLSLTLPILGALFLRHSRNSES